MLEIPDSTHPFRFYSPCSTHRQCCFYVTVCWFTVWFGFSSLSVFFSFFLVLWWFGCWLCSTPGCGGEHHEGEDAQERREVVVLLARQEQQQQIGNVACEPNVGIVTLCIDGHVSEGVKKIKCASLLGRGLWTWGVLPHRAGWEDDKQVRKLSKKSLTQKIKLYTL